MKSKIIAATLIGIFGFASCDKDDTSKTYDCSSVTVTYTNDIQSILSANCTSCHNASNASGGINLSTYASVKAVASQAKFMGSIQHESGYDAMPQGAAKLSDDNIKKLYCWVNGSMTE